MITLLGLVIVLTILIIVIFFRDEVCKKLKEYDMGETKYCGSCVSSSPSSGDDEEDEGEGEETAEQLRARRTYSPKSIPDDYNELLKTTIEPEVFKQHRENTEEAFREGNRSVGAGLAFDASVREPDNNNIQWVGLRGPPQYVPTTGALKKPDWDIENRNEKQWINY